MAKDQAAKKKTEPRFPKRIYVRQEEDSDGTFYYVIDEHIGYVDEDGKRMALYELADSGHVEVKRRFIGSKEAK